MHVSVAITTVQSHGFQLGFLGTLGFRQYILRAPLEVIQILGSTVCFSYPVKKCELGFREPLECILGVPLHRKG